jgi:apolipoprotein D and lipocalin family protein
LKAKFLILLFFTFFCSSCAHNYPPLQTVDSVDLNKYTGSWYEIASIPNSFQRGCYCTKATYGLVKNKDYISVLNQCRKNSTTGALSQAHGKAFIVPRSGNAKLQVQFFWPFLGDYWIIAIDSSAHEKYQYVMVGQPSRDYLWILSRKPTLPKPIYHKLLDIAQKKKFDVSRLSTTFQKDGCI